MVMDIFIKELQKFKKTTWEKTSQEIGGSKKNKSGFWFSSSKYRSRFYWYSNLCQRNAKGFSSGFCTRNHLAWVTFQGSLMKEC